MTKAAERAARASSSSSARTPQISPPMLEKLLLKLLIINPLLNSLGLGDQGNGKQLPTLWGSTGGSGGIGGLLSWLFGGAGASAPAAASSAADVGLTDTEFSEMMGGPALGFANGGEFVVGGMGGTDSHS